MSAKFPGGGSRVIFGRQSIPVLNEKFMFDNALSYCTPGRFYVMEKASDKAYYIYIKVMAP